MSNYMVPKPIAHLAAAPPHSPLSSPSSPLIPGVKHINYPTTPQQTVAQVGLLIGLSV